MKRHQHGHIEADYERDSYPFWLILLAFVIGFVAGLGAAGYVGG